MPAGPARSRRCSLPRLQQLAEKYPQIGEVRGRGAMLAHRAGRRRRATRRPNAGAGRQGQRGLPAAGLVTLTAGTYGNVFRFLPPLAIGDDLVNEGLDIFEAALRRPCRCLTVRREIRLGSAR